MAEPWLRGPIPGMPPVVMPAAHTLMQASEEIAAAVADLTPAQTWMTPGGAASIGFHLRHIAGSIDRLLTYARGEALTEAQLAAGPKDKIPPTPATAAAALVGDVTRAIEYAIGLLRATPPATYFEPRAVGRKRLPTNVLGVLVHVADHTQRHTGAIIATAKVVRSLGA
jgi:uncharacterized damage-inducible protein DinB